MKARESEVARIVGSSAHKVVRKRFVAHKDLSAEEIRDLIRTSKLKAVRTITDPRDGTRWYWDASMATHAWGARYLGVPYEAYGGGQVLLLD